MDGGGNVYVVDFDNTVATELSVTPPPSLSFASTNTGSESSDSPKTVTLENIGSEPLVFPVPGTGSDPSVSASFTLDSSITCPQVTSSGSAGMLAAGASCALPVDFIPATEGSIAGSVVLTDNNLNQSGATQSIGLSGTGTQASQTITFTSPGTGSRAQGGTVMVSASGGGSGNPVTFTSLTPSVCTNPNSQGISSLIAPGTCTFAANQAGNMDYSAAPQVTQSFTVTPVFVLTVNPSIIAKMPPGTAPVVLTLTPVNGFTGSVTLNCVLPAGVAKGTKCPGLPVTVKLRGGAAAVHDTGVQFPNGTNPATYVVTFTATDGKFNDSTTATFSVR